MAPIEYEYMAVVKPIIATSLSDTIKEFGFESGTQYIYKPEEV